MSAALPRAFGPYTLLDELGSGGSASAYLALGAAPERRPVVLKRIHENGSRDPLAMKRLRHEAAIAVTIDSPYVVRVEDVGAVDGEAFIAMERVSGCTVGRLLGLLEESKSKLSIAVVTSLINDALRGLEALHEAVHPETREPLGAVHRDVSPRNLIITPDASVVLIDLGLGKSNMRDYATRAGGLFGTPGYVSPEQVAGERVDHRADLYSLAVLAFELLTQKYYVERGSPMAMFEACCSNVFRPPSSLRDDVPASLDRILERALSVDPRARFGSAKEMAAELAGVSRAIGGAGARTLPEVYHREVDRVEERVRSLFEQATAAPPSLAPTEIWARRSVTRSERPALSLVGETAALTDTTLLLGPAGEISGPPMHVAYRGVFVLIAAAGVAVGIAVGHSIATPERVVIQPFFRAPQPAVSPSPSARALKRAIMDGVAPAPAPPEVDRRGRSAREARPPVKLAQKKPVGRASTAPPPESTPAEAAPDFKALIRAAADLQARRPDLSRALESLITEAMMWRRSEDTVESRSAYRRLAAELDRLEARAN